MAQPLMAFAVAFDKLKGDIDNNEEENYKINYKNRIQNVKSGGKYIF